MKVSLFALGLLLAALLSDRNRPPMVDPSIDDGPGPFCYFSRPTDQLGVMDGENGFQVTAEGYLYTRRAEIVFMAGPELKPVRQRIRTWKDGSLPVLEYAIQRKGVRYAWTLFAATLDGNPMSPLYAFVRIRAENRGERPAVARLGVAVRHRGPERGPARVRPDRDYPFRRRSLYAVDSGVVLRDGRALLFLPSQPVPALGATLEQPYEGPFRGADLDVIETTPVCPATWRWKLNRGESRTVDLAVPLIPILARDAAVVRPQVQKAFDRFLASTVERWKKLFDAAVDLVIPEKKAHDTFWTSLAGVAIARDQTAEDTWIQRVNELQYHTGFWPRDASYFMMAWWYAGLAEEGRRVVEHYFRIQKPDGSFENDPENISPFAIARWYRLTGDREYARKAFPYLWRNFQWLKHARAADSLGLMPRRGRYDNEGIDGHYTGHNFYNICALREAAAMARDLDKQKEAEEIEAEYAAFRRNFLERLEPLVEKYGQIPPGLDTGIEGANWGNLIGSYPTEVLKPDHPWIARTSDKLRKTLYEEGLLIYNAFGWWSLHHYATIKNTYADLLRGRDDLVVKDLYALLVHTSASNAGFEFCLVGWSNRDFGGNFSPHGWFAAKYIGLVRLMLVREEGDELHLLSALPPAWVAPDKRITAGGLPTRFGPVSLTVEGTKSGCLVKLDLPRTKEAAGPSGLPARVILHVPWYANLKEANADGKALPFEGRRLPLPVETREVALTFERDPAASIDYEKAVQEWKAEYRKRYQEWRGKHPEAEPFDPFPEKHFPTREESAPVSRAMAAAEGIAAGRPARASSAAEGNDASHATDGVGGENTLSWEPAVGDSDPWLTVDLGDETTVARIRVQAADGSPPLRFRLEASRDGDEWVLLADYWENGIRGRHSAYDLFFPALKTRTLRLRFPKNFRPRITEVFAYASPPDWRKPKNVKAGDKQNLALGQPTLSSEWEGENGPWNAVDGRTSWTEGFWAGAVGHPQWWAVDLGSMIHVARVRLFFHAGGQRGYAWVLQSSADGVRWRTLVEHRTPVPATNEGTEARFEKHRARYLRIIVLKNTANPAAHIAEVEVYAN